MPEGAEEMPDLADMDAAMAWLESLAAKQGADEATLVTPPEQRQENPPDWLEKEIAKQVAAPSVAGEDPFTAIEGIESETPTEETDEEEVVLPILGIEPVEQVEEPVQEEQELKEETIPTGTVPEAILSESNVDDFDSAFARLKSLAAKQGAEEGSLVNSPTARLETPPEWIQQAQSAEIEHIEPTHQDQDGTAQETEAQEVFVGEQAAKEQTAEEMPVQEPVSQEPETEANEVSGEISEPNLNTEQVSRWMPEFDTAEEDETSGSAAQEELPDWLQVEIEEESSSSSVVRSDEAALDEWLRGLETEAKSGSFVLEEPLEPTGVAFDHQWLPDQQTMEPSAPSGQLSDASVSDLASARDALNRGKLKSALNFYNGQVQEGSNLEEVIHDLRDALYRYPVDINLWQVLGDAFARNNQLQEALEAYTKAEELLR